jgi:hypothetical protein
MPESTIRQKIYTEISAITDIGMIYDYERWAIDWVTFINLFKNPVSGRILGWEIGRKGAPATYDSNAEETTTHQYVIRGFMGLKDADGTEKLFNAKIEDIRDKFRFNFTLDGLCEMAGPLSANIIEPRMFGGVLCHYCELDLPVQELFAR